MEGSMHAPKISVIVPVYNVEKYVAKCIDSIIGQSFEDWELILIDDASTDGSADVCREYQAKDKRISFYANEVNSGVSATRNRGFDICRGDYVFFLDSDDWFDSDMFNGMLSACVDNNAEIAVCGQTLETLNDDGTIECELSIFTKGSSVEVLPLSDALYRIEGGLVVHNKLIKRSIIGENRFDTSLTYQEDVIFFLTIAENAMTIAITPEPYYHYFINRNGNVVSAPLNERYIELINNSEMIYSLLSNLGYPSLGIRRKMVTLYKVLAKIPFRSRHDACYKKYFDACKKMIDSIPQDDRNEYFKNRNHEHRSRFFLRLLSANFNLGTTLYMFLNK